MMKPIHFKFMLLAIANIFLLYFVLNNPSFSPFIILAVNFFAFFMLFDDLMYIVFGGLFMGFEMLFWGISYPTSILSLIGGIISLFMSGWLLFRLYWVDILIKLGKPEIAIQHISNLIKIFPREMHFHKKRADVYYLIEQYPQALARYQQILDALHNATTTPDEWNVYLYEITYREIFFLYLKMGDLKNADDLLQTGIPLEYQSEFYEFAQLILNVTLKLSSDHHAQAIHLFDQADIAPDLITKAPEYWHDLLFHVALAHYQMNNHAEAKALWEQLPPDYHQYDDNTHLPDHIQILIDEFQKMLATQG